MPARPPVSAEDVPQSVVAAARGQRRNIRAALTAALAEYARLGSRLVRDDEAARERMADAIYRAIEAGRSWPEVVDAALTAAQGGEDG